ncbi:hypothetical protein VNO77_03939 [Canavalia gladiata]|uniref:Uncharacterized protein n=1 Tax=Canavalia gladiata TaxID=3824 RepID=A0AAN9N1A9_CANGL
MFVLVKKPPEVTDLRDGFGDIFICGWPQPCPEAGRIARKLIDGQRPALQLIVSSIRIPGGVVITDPRPPVIQRA